MVVLSEWTKDFGQKRLLGATSIKREKITFSVDLLEGFNDGFFVGVKVDCMD